MRNPLVRLGHGARQRRPALATVAAAPARAAARPTRASLVAARAGRRGPRSAST
jgi:hypothetical protein